ncbi:MAG: SpoIIIAH-like family protein [Clostridiales bacterium]|jgi:stage III sporulation protein AH|nr:SpoIIIAH-like family protein [Clostridiales bacterium]
MFKIKRNQVIIAALVVMIAIAGYLNYIDTAGNGAEDGLTYDQYEDQRKAETLVDGAGQEVAVIMDGGEDTSAVTVTDVTSQTIAGEDVSDVSPVAADSPGTAVFVNNSSDSSFFIQAKLDREQSRARERDTLSELINNSNVDKDQKAACVATMQEIRARIEKETAAEALIEAKGFAEAYVRIDDTTVDVIVSKSQLSDAEIAQIEDIVKRKTGVDSSAIRVAPLKSE